MLSGADEHSDCLGVDPDCHNTAFAVVRKDRLFSVGCTYVSKKIKGQRCAPHIFKQSVVKFYGTIPSLVCVMEGQTIRKKSGHETKNALSIVQLAMAAGAALGAVMAQRPDAVMIVVDPVVWKGSVPKQIHQVRLLKKLCWSYETVGNVKTGYARPIDPTDYDRVCGADSLRKGDWKHVMDAIGLAFWLNDQLKAEVRRRGK